MSHFLSNITSYNSDIMLAAVISLLLVILFVLLLHVYAKWFFSRSRDRVRRAASVSLSHVSYTSRPSTSDNHTTTNNFASKGLDTFAISSIPVFIYKEKEGQQQGGLECIICLSVFEENEVGRRLIKCGHGFHVECIDMWLHSHVNCPICRANIDIDIVVENALDANKAAIESSDDGEITTLSEGESRLEIVNENEGIVVNCDSILDSQSLSSSSSSSSPSSLIGCSLKRMLSRNRSEKKVFPSSNVSQSDPSLMCSAV